MPANIDTIPYTPADQLVVYAIKNKDGDIEYHVIGNATNIMINTTRGKVPIFTFGRAEAAAISRGALFISGSMDSIVIDITKLDEFLKQNTVYITEVEKRIIADTEGENSLADRQLQAINRKIFGNTVTLYNILESSIDSLKLEELILISTKPYVDSGNAVWYSSAKLVDVEFHTYSYQKRSTDVVQLERLEFIARALYPFQYHSLIVGR